MTPSVSVLVVTFGARDWVARALDALRDHTPIPHQVVVVDNGSTDGTLDLLRARADIELVEAGRNLGFGVANDVAALHARADLLCLLNSDALVPAGWTQLLEWFDDPTVGAAVPEYLWPDGRVQEAGAAIHADGLVAPFGVGDVPAWPFVRDVQYASAACWVVRRALFEQLGGFDAAYAPAYYEDTDFALRMHAAGARIVFDPRVRVVHAQGASSGSAARAVALREANRARFTRTWAPLLTGRPRVHDAPYPHHRIAARDLHAPDRVVIVTPAEPAPGTDAVRVGEAVNRALDAGRVTVLSHGSLHPALDERWRTLGIEHVELAELDAIGGWLEARAGQCSVLVADRATRDRVRTPWFAAQGHHDHADLATWAAAARDGTLDTHLLDHGLVPRHALVSAPAGGAGAYPRPTEESP